LPELGTEKIESLQAPLPYDHPDGETIILIVNPSLYNLVYDNLVCDNQCRMNDVVISDSCPKSPSETRRMTPHIEVP
jgi:hypothetical protein